MANYTYSMQEVEAQTGVNARTLRYWIRHRIVPKPIGRGRGARYDERHLLCARVTRVLREQGKSLHEIRNQIARSSPEELAALAPASRPVGADGTPVPPPAPTYPFSLWEIVSLSTGIALMVDPTRGAGVRRVADEIYRHYGTVRHDTRQ